MNINYNLLTSDSPFSTSTAVDGWAGMGRRLKSIL